MYQTFWIKIRTDVLSVLIWIQTVCNGYRLMTKVKVAASKESMKKFSANSTSSICVYLLTPILKMDAQTDVDRHVKYNVIDRWRRTWINPAFAYW